MGRRKKAQTEGLERLPRAMSAKELLSMNIPTLEFSEPWARVFGTPSRQGTWIIWGDSGSGKTSFALQLARELTKFGKVVYNSLEQGASLTMQQAVARHGLDKEKKKFQFVSENLETLSVRLSRSHSPSIVIIDSLQYTGLRYRDYKAFKEEHKKKLLIFISHAQGGKPEGAVGTKVMYDAELKVLVEGYRAISKGRTFGEDPDACYTIWEEGAARYWLKDELR